MRGVGGTWPDVSVTRLGSLNDPTPSKPFPGVIGQDPSLGAYRRPEPTPFNQEWWFVDPEFDQAYSMQWNFGVQHQLAQSTVLEVNYVGSGSRDLSVGGGSIRRFVQDRATRAIACASLHAPDVL